MMMDRNKSSSSLTSKNGTINGSNNNNNNDNNRITKEEEEEDDEIKFLKKVHRWDKMMRNNSFTWDDTPGNHVNNTNKI